MTFTHVVEQVKLSTTNLTDFYTIPEVVVSEIVSIAVCNLSATPTTFRIARSVGGGSIADKDYIYYDEPIGGNKTFFVTLILFGHTADIIRVKGAAATLSFNLDARETT